MEIVHKKEMLISTGVPKNQIDIHLWQCEYESAAINVLNCSDKDLQVSAHLSPARGPKGIIVDSRKTFTIRRAIYVNERKAGSIADALVLQNEREFSIEPGETVQLWITVFNPTLGPGTYEATITVKAKQINGIHFPDEKLRINMTIEPIKLGADVALNCCVWAYPTIYQTTKNSLAEAIRDLQLHYTNVFVVDRWSLPFPRKQFAIQMNNYPKTYLFFFGFSEKNLDLGRFGEWMTPSWKRNFSSWLIKWVEHLKKTGLDYDRFAMYPFDEMLGDEFYKLAKLIKSADPKIRIYANSFGKGPADFKRFRNLVDIWCFAKNKCNQHPDWLAQVKGFGKDVWMYQSLGPSKANHPYSYYRLKPWWAFKHGLTGAGFWVYIDYGYDDSWDGAGYGVVYGSAKSPVNTGGENIVPSRRWQAWREGIEDYEYLWQMQKAVEKIRITEPNKANQIQQFIKNQVDKVLENPDDCDMVYKAREELTHTLIQLKNEIKNR
jgi:hypothetical protein